MCVNDLNNTNDNEFNFQNKQKMSTSFFFFLVSQNGMRCQTHAHNNKKKGGKKFSLFDLMFEVQKWEII